MSSPFQSSKDLIYWEKKKTLMKQIIQSFLNDDKEAIAGASDLQGKPD